MAKYGLWSLARRGWIPDPMSDADPPPPLKFETVMEAIMAAAGYHFSFYANPVRMDDAGEPYRDDLAQLNDAV